MCDEKIISIEDDSGDELVVEESCVNSSKEVFFITPSTGVFVSAEDVKKLRKHLKQWLIENGHKKANGS